MKKLISLLMVMLLFVALVVVPASAEDSAQTVVSVNKGDEVTYTLYLSDVPEKVVGCDFSLYYDSSEYKLVSYADFTGNYDPDEHQAFINPNLPGELRCNWSILSGIKFADRKLFASVKLKALKDADTHLSYYVRYMYPESMQMFTEYTFTCDVVVNKTTVIENEAPELNVDEPQADGDFVNSVTGKGEDADINVAVSGVQGESGGSNGGEANENTVSSKKINPKKNDKNNDKDTDTDVVEETSIADVGGADGPSTVSQTTDTTASSPWLWIILAVIVVIAGVGAYVVIKKKKNSAQ